MIRDRGNSGRLAALPLWLLVGICCVLPLAWLLLAIIAHPQVLGELRWDSYRAALLWHTLVYNGTAAILAVLMGLPAATLLGRGRGMLVGVMWIILPVSVLLPSISYAYGWAQVLRLLHIDPAPQGMGDVVRCVWTLATWLWALPAGVIGLALRASDAQVQQQALLDGALLRVTFRQLAGPILASAAIVAALAMQEFSVYERTGINVVATEVRLVYETGVVGAGQAWQTKSSSDPRSQPARAAAAVVVSLPMLLAIGALAVVAIIAMRGVSAAEGIDAHDWPKALDAGWVAKALTFGLVVLTLVVPIAALALSLKRPMDLGRMWRTFSPQICGSIAVGAATGFVAAGAAFCAAAKRARRALVVATITFLVGGQIVAIAQIRLYNRPWLWWVYDAAPIVVMTYLARFLWIALAAGSACWAISWKVLRDQAGVDGAGRWQTARAVIWPLAWPLCVAAGVLVMILSLGEVPATVLLCPQRPPLIVPMLVTWVHNLRSDDMIEASLLLMGAVMVLAIGAAALAWAGLRAIRNRRAAGIASIFVTCYLLLVAGCGDASQPRAIWCETGNGPAQVVYPRAIAYSRPTDTFFIVDRLARVQQIDQRGQCISEWRMPQWQQGRPVGLSVSPDGLVYVADTHYHRVMIYKPNGTLVRQLGKEGMGKGQFLLPTHVAFDSKGNIFVSEYGDNDRIQAFDRAGNYLYEFGRFGQGPGEFSRPQSMVIDGDMLYVTDACNHRIEVFKTDGTFMRSMGGVGSDLGQFRFPYGLDMDSRGRLVVCELGNNRVQLIDKQSGKGLATWGAGGREPGQLAYPWAVAVDRHDNVVVVDSGNNRLQVFGF